MTKRRVSGRSAYTETESGSILRVRGNQVRLQRNNVPQSSLDLDAPEDLDFEYMQHMHLFFLATPLHAGLDRNPVWAFHAGAGALALPLAWNSHSEQIFQLAVDIDEDLVREMRKVARLDRNRRLRLRAGEAEKTLLRSTATYDVIVRDAFEGSNTPLHLQTQSFHELVASRLKPSGIYLANVGHDSDQPGKPDLAGIAEVFSHVAVITDPSVWHRGRPGNLAVAAWQRSGPDLDRVDRSVRSQPLPTRLYRNRTVRDWLGGAKAIQLSKNTQTREQEA